MSTTQARFNYGGQAVLEGVMMRGRNLATVVVRRADGSFARKDIAVPPSHNAAWTRLPLLRGIASLMEAFTIGRQALDFSADVVGADEAAGAADSGTIAPWLQQLIFAATLLIGIGLFVVLPSFIADWIGRISGSVLVREAVEGLINLALAIGYLAAIGRMPDVARVFGYHGAEHKTINAYEAGVPLTIDRVRSFSRIHPRCGTSFLLLAALVGFIVFLSVATLPIQLRIAARIVMIPLVAALAFELMALAARNYRFGWVRGLMAPTLASQYLTTREPDDAMIAVAIAALEPVLAADGVIVAPADDSAANDGTPTLSATKDRV
jgi:uncharacterized protein YqhQ